MVALCIPLFNQASGARVCTTRWSLAGQQAAIAFSRRAMSLSRHALHRTNVWVGPCVVLTAFPFSHRTLHERLLSVYCKYCVFQFSQRALRTALRLPGRLGSCGLPTPALATAALRGVELPNVAASWAQRLAGHCLIHVSCNANHLARMVPTSFCDFPHGCNLWGGTKRVGNEGGFC